jgi:hypothetical protein
MFSHFSTITTGFVALFALYILSSVPIFNVYCSLVDLIPPAYLVPWDVYFESLE